MADWTEVYRPTTLAGIRGNDKATARLREWAEAWPNHRKAVILYGSPGIGKTSAAHALANDMGWDTVELNASDQRTAAVITRIAGEASISGTLSHGGGGRRLIILDEADNFHGNADYGGSGAVTKLVKNASQPVILIANEFYDMSTGLRNACETIEFRSVSARSILPVLRDICRKEGVEFEEEALERIAENTSGDLRSAINDLQAIAERSERLTVDSVVTGGRDRTKGIFEFLDAVFKEEDAAGALRASYDVDETPDDLIRWIEDNLPKDYDGPELVSAYRSLCRADRWLGRVQASQEYRYWRYAADNMTAGVAASRQVPKGGWTRYGPPSYWAKLGRSRSARDKRDHIAREIAESSGVSMGTARRMILPYLATMTHHCKDRELTINMTARYNLEPGHVAFITGSGADTKKVKEIVQEAKLMRGNESTLERVENPNPNDKPDDALDDSDSPSETDSTEESGQSQSGLTDFM